MTELFWLQLFQLTALFVPGPQTSGEKFVINLDLVLVAESEVRGALLCVQDFVKSPHSIHWSFFSDSGIAILTESLAISDSISTGAVFERWG